MSARPGFSGLLRRLSRTLGQPVGPKPTRRPSSHRIGVETLESRELLSASGWSFASGFSSTAGLTVNGFDTAPALSGTRLRLTDGAGGEGRSAFASTAVDVSQFSTDFSFQLSNAGADGMAFVIQGTGPTALGAWGGGLGYQGIGKSVGVVWDLYNNAGEGTNSTGIYTNGAAPWGTTNTNLTGSGIDLHSGDLFNVHINYDGTTLSVTTTDSVTKASATQTYAVDIRGAVGGNNAYVGFTAGTGGLVATQDVIQWNFQSQTGAQTLVTAINAAGAAAGSYLADTDVTGGLVNTGVPNVIDTSGVTDPAPQAVYNSFRYGDFTYVIPNLTANANYTVRLDFAEDFVDGPGQRVFNVAINNTQVLNNFDIFAATGAEFKAITKQFGATADASGKITIAFTTVTGSARINGIAIYGAAAAPQSTALAIDAGGGAAGSFVADTNFIGGQTYANTDVITTTGVTNPAPQAVYQSERYGPSITYSAPGLTPGATYTVRLHFAEIWWTSAGTRIFNVAINGSPVLSNFDIFAQTGGKDRAIVETFTAVADSSGKITIVFTGAPGSPDGNAKVSGIEILTAQPIAPPAAPANVTATASDSQVSLNWTASAGAVSYTVYRSTSSGSEISVRTGITGTSFTDAGLANGTTYYYKVTAVNAGGESGKSNEALATPRPAPPVAPAGLTAQGGNGQVTLSWNASSGATSYNIYRATTAGGETLIKTGVTGTSYADASLANGTAYYYKVTAVNAGGESGRSSEAAATPINTAVQTGWINMVWVDPSSGTQFKYMIFVPHSYNPNTPTPTILFLHGVGEKGTDGYIQTTVGLGTYIRANDSTFSYIAIFPQLLPSEGTWASGPETRSLAMLNQIESAYNVDKKRVILTGLSLGGQGVWWIGFHHPDIFAAMVSISGFADPSYIPNQSVPFTTPIWAFHAADDGTVPISWEQPTVDFLKSHGGNVTYTVYPTGGHGIWDEVYARADLWTWIGQQHLA